MLLQREIEAFHHCKHSVVVSESDRDFFCVHGITDLRVITNPVKLPDFIKNPIREQGDKPHEPGSSALFIGSSWYPNLQAAQNIVNHIAPYCPNIHFFIAGACSLHLGRHPSNVTYLGRISSEVLDQYYRDVTYALVPLAVGTGTSLKTVEAMAYGKVVISTSIGVRGIAFENGVHGIICDEISRFHQILHSLEHDIHKKLLLSRNAMLLARNYDYQHVFEQYLDMMHDMEVRENVSMVVPETCE
jgi:glycosyltransferase involved in cell wall biosynthesis